jgi:hypothetical protein
MHTRIWCGNGKSRDILKDLDEISMVLDKRAGRRGVDYSGSG